MPKPKYLYACGVDFQHEMDAIPSEVYPSVESLKQHRKCWESCGIVQLEIKEVSWPVDQDLFKDIAHEDFKDVE